jgi:hypothetical protein
MEKIISCFLERDMPSMPSDFVMSSISGALFCFSSDKFIDKIMGLVTAEYQQIDRIVNDRDQAMIVVRN